MNPYTQHTEQHPPAAPAPTPKRRRRWIAPALTGVAAFFAGSIVGATGASTDTADAPEPEVITETETVVETVTEYIVPDSCRDALDASGMHHVVDETGDGDWEVVWEALALLRPERDALAARLAAVEALADRWRHCGDPGDSRRQAATALRAVLSAAPTDTTKETP